MYIPVRVRQWVPFTTFESERESHSAVSNCDPWTAACDSPGKNTGVGCHSPSPGVLLTQGSGNLKFTSFKLIKITSPQNISIHSGDASGAPPPPKK